MKELTDEEKVVLHALNQLQPAPLEEVVAFTGYSESKVQEILERLAAKRLLRSENTKGDADPAEAQK